MRPCRTVWPPCCLETIATRRAVVVAAALQPLGLALVGLGDLCPLVEPLTHRAGTLGVTRARAVWETCPGLAGRVRPRLGAALVRLHGHLLELL